MRSHHKYLFVLTAVAVTTVIAMASLREPGRQAAQDAPRNQQPSRPDESAWPVAAYEHQERLDEKQRARREARGSRYNNSYFGVRGAINSAREDVSVVLSHDEEEVDTPPLPVPQSSIVVIGTVLDAKAFVSADQTGVYSEFPTRVNEVLKTDWAAQLDPGSVITVQRAGGRVQGPSARILFRMMGQNMPRVGAQYVMFLRRLDEGEDYKIITGYELREGKVFPLDSVDTFARYSAWDRARFLQALQDAMAQP